LRLRWRLGNVPREGVQRHAPHRGDEVRDRGRDPPRKSAQVAAPEVLLSAGDFLGNRGGVVLGTPLLQPLDDPRGVMDRSGERGFQRRHCRLESTRDPVVPDLILDLTQTLDGVQIVLTDPASELLFRLGDRWRPLGPRWRGHGRNVQWREIAPGWHRKLTHPLDGVLLHVLERGRTPGQVFVFAHPDAPSWTRGGSRVPPVHLLSVKNHQNICRTTPTMMMAMQSAGSCASGISPTVLSPTVHQQRDQDEVEHELFTHGLYRHLRA
jgi:hypothetical protein